MLTENPEEKFQLDLLQKNVSNVERKIRQDALENLLAKCSNENLSVDAARNIYDLFYLPIFKCYADRFETCRSLACSIISALMDKLPLNDYYAEYAISIICRRIGQTEIIEESEEMRLMFLQQTTAIVRKFKKNDSDDKDRLVNCYNDVIDILVKTLRDPFRDVQLECCTLIKLLPEATNCFHVRAEQLVNPILPMLEHRQSPNRKAAVGALGILALQVNAKGDTISKIITSVSPLLMDPMPNVRLECGLVGCLWLLKLRDRYSFFERLLPLVLSCLKDDTPEVRERISAEWIPCGLQYFNENEKELSDLELVDKMPIKYPINTIRPTLGCRAIMQRSIRMIAIVLREMQDWKEEVRFHALRLLWQVILHGEKALTAKFIDIFPVLSKCCNDKEKRIVEEAKKCAQLLGNLLDYKDWIELGLKELKQSDNLGVLVCFSRMYDGADEEKHRDFPKLAAILTDSSKCNSLKEQYQNELLNLTDLLVDICLSNENEMEKLNLTTVDRVEKQLLYTILVKVIALSYNHQDVHAKGKSILTKLVKSAEKVREFHGKYFHQVLASIEDLDAENSERAESIILLHGLISFCGFQEEYLDPLKTSIKLVLDNAGASAKIKVLSAVSVSMLRWNETMATTSENSYNQLKKFIVDIIEPCLVWRAGRSSESIRAMATSCLCSMAQGAKEETYHLFPDLAVQLGQLIDDNNVVTRGYALKCLFNCEPLNYERLKPLALGVLARLDDPSSEVREYSTKIIGQLKIRNDASEFDVESWENITKHILTTLVLHLDDPEIKLRSSLFQSIGDIARNHKKIFDEVLSNLPKSFPYWIELEAVRTVI